LDFHRSSEQSRTFNLQFRPSAVLFDLDGTLVEFKFKVRESRRAMIEWLRLKGFKVQNLTEATRTQEIIDAAYKEWKEGSIDSPIRRSFGSFEAVKAELSSILDQFEFAAFQDARPHTGSLETLKELRQRKIELAIVTNSGRRPVDSVLKKFGFLQFVSLVLTRNELSRLKPDPEGLIKALNIFKVRREGAVFVGDSIIDIEAARNAGIRSIAVSCGMYSESELKKNHPDFLISKIEELVKLIP